MSEEEKTYAPRLYGERTFPDGRHAYVTMLITGTARLYVERLEQPWHPYPSLLGEY